ncbi:hypothetical protein FRB90_000237 [Tulasnella sp. 427]|nr:hypothetical protein FRB90_000237 [Tulasnella sp. 427]
MNQNLSNDQKRAYVLSAVCYDLKDARDEHGVDSKQARVALRRAQVVRDLLLATEEADMVDPSILAPTPTTTSSEEHHVRRIIGRDDTTPPPCAEPQGKGKAKAIPSPRSTSGTRASAPTTPQPDRKRKSRSSSRSRPGPSKDIAPSLRSAPSNDSDGSSDEGPSSPLQYQSATERHLKDCYKSEVTCNEWVALNAIIKTSPPSYRQNLGQAHARMKKGFPTPVDLSTSLLSSTIHSEVGRNLDLCGIKRPKWLNNRTAAAEFSKELN